MREREILDRQIMLEVVRWIVRSGEQIERQETLSELIQNLPPGANINTVIGAIYNHEENLMGDTYKTGQAGSVGRGSFGVGNTFSQVWIERESDLDLAKLSVELKTLRAAARELASGEVEHDRAIGALAEAEQAASDGDGPGVLRHLRAAGEWILGVAKSIGVPVAIKAIEASLGASN